MPAIAIVGAGLAGAAAARTFHAAGYEAAIFDKGRGAGGRLATRRVEIAGRHVAIEHGAPSLQPSDARFAALLDELAARGEVRYWAGPPRGRIGAAGMSGLVRALLGPVTPRYGTTVEAIERDGEGALSLSAGDDVFGPFAFVLVTVPAQQAIPLLRAARRLQTVASAAAHHPTWTLMFVWAHAPAGLATASADALSWGDPRIAHLIAGPRTRDASAEEGTLVVHLSPTHSARVLETEREEMARHWRAELMDRLGLPAPDVALAHRWRFASVRERALCEAPLDPDSRLAIAGDWVSGPTRPKSDGEAAYLSGERAAQAILQTIRTPRASAG